MLGMDINSIGITLLGALLAFLTTWFWFARNQALKKAEVIAKQHEALLVRVKELEDQAKVTGTVVTPIITAFQALLIKQLTHVGKPEMDLLMVKAGPPDELTSEERDRLMAMLHERTTDMGVEITPAERDAAVILPFVMKMVAVEQAHLANTAAITDLKLVTIVSVVGATRTGEEKVQ